ncbi:hypothetical protein AXI58_15165 [Bacillus nakamurai]|uniref:Uncharacterized protein n=1 Tax=Bacillus nakamurai TaxID=1793963 RepID=A0A150F7T6_9BACI|nr:hypothetical protein AXI58_15165 [Bacillus nakamurai]
MSAVIDLFFVAGCFLCMFFTPAAPFCNVSRQTRRLVKKKKTAHVLSGFFPIAISIIPCRISTADKAFLTF